MRLKADYPALPILTTENGIPDETSDLPVDDPYRVSFLRDHFVQASRAIGITCSGDVLSSHSKLTPRDGTRHPPRSAGELMSDSTPTQKITTVVDSDAPKSRTLLYVLIGIGALLLIAVIVLIATLLSNDGTPTTAPSSTRTASPTPSPTPSEPSATPTPTQPEAPAPPPAPAPDPIPGFDSFAYEQDAGCQPGDSQQQLTFSWSSDDAVRAYVGVQTNNAKTGSYSGELPAVYTYSDIYYNCGQASQYYTVTLEDAAGRLTHNTVTIKP